MTKKYQLYIINYLNVYNYVNIYIYIVFSPLCYVYFYHIYLTQLFARIKSARAAFGETLTTKTITTIQACRGVPCLTAAQGFPMSRRVPKQQLEQRRIFEPNWQCKVANLRQNPSLIVSCWFIACHLSPTTIVVGFLWACRTLQINRRRRCLGINGHDW